MAYLEGEEVTEEQITKAIRKSVIARQFSPVLIGSAYKNKGIQKVLDAVNEYLPTPNEVENTGLDLANDEAPIILATDNKKPFVGLAFKLEENQFGQLTYMRVYQGKLKKGA